MRESGGSPFTSDLSVSEFALMHAIGARPLAQVMGSSIYHVGWQQRPGSWGMQIGAISQSSMSPVTTVIRSASWFITGNAPGKPRQTGQVWVFGAAPNSTGHVQNIFERVFSWT